MYADHAKRRRVQPGGLAASLAVSGLVIAAFVNVAPEIGIGIRDSIPLIPNIPADPPPPKPVEQKPDVKTPVIERIYTPKPIIDQPVRGDPIDVTVDPPKNPSGPAIGAEPEPVIVEPLPPVFVGAEPDPRYAADFQPPYPADMQRANAEGRVAVKVLIGADGRVKAVEALSGERSFVEATRRQALSRWRFRPATRGGVAVESWKTLTLRFELTG